MLRDSTVWRIARKEITLFFASPVAWLFLGSFAAVTLFAFFWGEAFFARNVADGRPLFEWMPILLIFLGAALTMRMWSEERRTGTLEHVITQPVPLWHFVLGKFAACKTLLLLALLVTLPLPVTVAVLGDLDWGPVIAGYLATLFLGCSYISIGLFVSSRTDNPIVSLIGTVVLCSLVYLIGTDTFTGFFGTTAVELLRGLSTGARFDAITRGVIDLRDLVYYASLVLVFLTLNVYTLERERWSTGAAAHHRRWRAATALVLVNALVANLWLSQVNSLRLDVTEGRLYSISDATHRYLSQLQEPLLLRGYFSAKTHPLLAPLVPQLRDLLKEYEVAGDGKVRIEIVDPAQDPALEQEANQKYGIQAVPFQVADRYQAALVNSYFNVLVQYGDSHQVLGFGDLIEVKAGAATNLDVQLRNPEFDLTRAIKQVLYEYAAGGNLFDSIPGELEFVGYVSADQRLPQELIAYREAIAATLEDVAADANDRFSFRFVDPEAGDGAVARRIEEEWGFRPMAASLLDTEGFYFYLTLEDDRQVVQIPTDFEADNFRQALDASLKRFASGFTRVVAVAAPQVSPQMAQFGMAGPQYRNLEAAVAENHTLRTEDLEDGSVSPEADVLMVVAPENLSEKAVFAIDQYLMKGGSVVLVTAPYLSQFSGGTLAMINRVSGLEEWLDHHGISLGKRLVLDPRNAAFPVPVTREVGGFRFQEVRMVDYPYFVDVRAPGLNPDHPITSAVPQLTMAWAAPIELDPEKHANRQTEVLISSSEQAWTDDSMEVLPRVTGAGVSDWQPGESQQAYTLGAVISGRFESFFAGKPSPLIEQAEASEDAGDASEDEDAEPDPAGYSQVLERSPESARLVVYSSNDFLRDQILGTLSSMSGAQYLGSLELIANTLDWTLEDEGLLGIRSLAHFNRSLPPMEASQQRFWEYLNYALALLALGLIALWQFGIRRSRRAYYAALLGDTQTQ
ncbi:MAG: Gldg family protein [Halieaceae bacterium]|jgi:ABC-2 type transport system permease protein|nr:Gldg family protein [Halieaceae bacterium]